MERHEYEPCTHEGRHGYTLLSDEQEHEFCERCRRGPEAHNIHVCGDECRRQQSLSRKYNN